MSATNSMVSAEFRDCDAYFDAINHVNVRFTLQGLETSIWRIECLTLPRGVNIQYCWSGSGSIAQGVSRDGGFELAVPATGHYTANAEPVPFESALFMVPGSEFLVSIPGSHSWFNVFVPELIMPLVEHGTDSEAHLWVVVVLCFFWACKFVDRAKDLYRLALAFWLSVDLGLAIPTEMEAGVLAQVFNSSETAARIVPVVVPEYWGKSGNTIRWSTPRSRN